MPILSFLLAITRLILFVMVTTTIFCFLLITNIFYTPDNNHICEQINFDYNRKRNDLELIVFNNFLLQNNKIRKETKE